MVSLWPWKKDDASSFEKTLSALSAKITATQSQLERARASSRRARVLSTLYLSFAYLVYAIVALLVVGWRNMGAYEWSGIAGGPVLIYLVRTVSSTVYELRIESLSSRLKDQQAERAKTIQKLKDATRYDSTLELLEKYGGGDTKAKPKRKNTGDGDGEQQKKSPGKQNAAPPNRIHMPPPATANIPRHNMPPAGQATPQQRLPSPGPAADMSAEFAPNAYDSTRPPHVPGGQHQTASAGPQNHWYDRVMDLLLGEDETAAKNRIVLICQRCRLVNGQAPPGTTSLSQFGTWKCMACGATNGEVDEGKRLVKEVLDQQMEAGVSTDGNSDEEESGELVDVQSDNEPAESEQVPALKAATETTGRRGKAKK